jgi:hypothetical protein
MEHLTAAVRNMQLGQDMIMDSQRTCQKEMADIRSTTKEIKAAINHLRSTQADFEATLTKRVKNALDSMDRKLQSFLQQLSKQETVVTLLGKEEFMDSLSMAVKQGLQKELVKDEVGSISSSSCVERGTNPKGLMLPETKSRNTERPMCLPCGCLPLNDFSEDYRHHLEKLVKYRKEENMKASFSSSRHADGVKGKLYQNLKVDGRIGDKPCLVSVDTGASTTVVRSDMAEGLPERHLPMRVYLQCISGQAIPVLKEALVKLTLGKSTLILWVQVADITEEFSLGLDVMYKHHVIVDLKRHVLRVGNEEVSLRRPYRVSCTVANGEIAEARCETVDAEMLKQSLDEVNGLGKGGFLSRHSR